MIGLTWTGYDGSHWDLRNGPVWITNGGMSGLSMPPISPFTRDTAERDGQQFTGWRALPRDVLLPVRIGYSQLHDDEWLDVERRWWNTMRPSVYGYLTATAPDGSARSLALRFVDDGTASFEKDPSIMGGNNLALRMVADQPFWKGEPFGGTFSHGGVGQDFFGGAAGYGPPFIITASSTLDNTVVNNAGDLPTYPTYVISGPCTSFTITVDGYAIGGNITVADGQTLTIETDPTRQLATLKTIATGVSSNVTRQLSKVNFHAIPAGETLQVLIDLSGNGSVEIVGRPLYFRGW